MGWWKWLFGLEEERPSAGDDNMVSSHDACPSVNPATGLPMADCSVDVGGNPFGTDLFGHDDVSGGLDDTLGTWGGIDDNMGGGIGSDW
ncbi:hypothetical protein [Sulfurivirga sp.]|uniref:hypothetical protein n=1 Tax=Sulfurivirga sp. TaxID=2614236 RepID=UPI0025FED5BE|nr:hypothetical protein [Sulfurivirga sp.]